jgi:hypothetical protein
LYKITFEEVPYYYYGVHKEKKFDEYYMGSPKTNKWCWEFYTPKKQILEIFPYTDEGWIEAQKVEKKLIKPYYNIDKWCLNESCGGIISLKILRKSGKISGKKSKENKTGICGLSKEERIKNGKIGGKISGYKSKENKTGIFGLSKEQRIENGKKSGKIGGQKTYDLKIGVHSLSQEQMRENGKKSGKIGGKKSGQQHKENRTGIFGMTEEQKKQRDSNGGKISTSQIWECTITGYRTNAGALANYQKARGIDKSLRVRIS